MYFKYLSADLRVFFYFCSWNCIIINCHNLDAFHSGASTYMIDFVPCGDFSGTVKSSPRNHYVIGVELGRGSVRTFGYGSLATLWTSLERRIGCTVRPSMPSVFKEKTPTETVRETRACLTAWLSIYLGKWEMR